MDLFSTNENCIEDLKSFLKIPSVSTDSRFNKNVKECSEFLISRLENIGFDNIKSFTESIHPIIYAEKIIKPSLPTLLIYGHYDVQPADPINLWDSPPFEPTIKDGKIYARGASDDKSQVHLILVALNSIVKENKLECNIKVVFEGEEEIGSPGLYTFVEKNKELLKANTLLVCDTAMPELNKPALINGLRGIAYYDIEVFGAPYDLHSGMNGGGVINPFNELCRVIGLIKNSENELIIPALIKEKSQKTNEETETKIINDLVNFKTGDNYYSQTTLKTSFDVHGISGGYIGEGTKTVIPSNLKAKVSFRLAQGHSYEYITTIFDQFLKKNFHKSVTYKLNLITACNAVEVLANSPEMKLASECLATHFANKPTINRIGGTIPVVSLFKEKLNLTPLLMGFGLDDDRIHSPNECFSLYNYFKGIEVLKDFIVKYPTIITSNYISSKETATAEF